MAKMKAAGITTVGSGGSVRSPQLARTAVCAKHFGLRSIHVIGADIRTAVRHDSVSIAAAFGAEFVRSKVAYNPALQKRALELHAANGYGYIEYGMGTDLKRMMAAQIEEFYRLGSEQVANLPSEMTTLLVPAGSCNTCVAVLYGVARFRPKNLRHVVLFGIGPTRIDYIEQRLQILASVSGIAITSLFERRYHDHPDLVAKYGVGKDTAYILEHHDLNAHFATYDDEMPERLGDVDLHPIYEGKILRYMRQRPAQFVLGSSTCFWLVGTEARRDALFHFAPRELL